jgi:outer membrane protein assembly factor BamB
MMMKKAMALLGVIGMLGGCASSELVDESAQPAALTPINETQVFSLELTHQVGLSTNGAGQGQPMRTSLSSISVPYSPFAPGVQLFSREGVNYFPSGKTAWMAYQATGRVWTTQLEGEVQSNSLPTAQGVFYVGTSKGKVYGLSLLTGEVMWTQQLSSEVLSLSVQEGRLFARTADGVLTALLLESGKSLWVYQRDLPKLMLRGVSQPAVMQGRVYLGNDAGRLSVLELASGKLLADLSLATSSGFTDLARMSDIDATPQLLADGQLLVQVYQGQLLALDAKTGRAAWELTISSNETAWVEDGRFIYLVSADSEVYKIDAATGLQIWKNDALRFRYLGQPILLEAVLYAVDKAGFIQAFDSQTGELIGRLTLGEALQYPMAVVEGALLVATRSGSFYRLKVKAKE